MKLTEYPLRDQTIQKTQMYAVLTHIIAAEVRASRDAAIANHGTAPHLP